MGELVYFSSTSENTHRFVEKLGMPAKRIPLHDTAGSFEVDEPFVLIVPTYGGGSRVMGKAEPHVPKQVVRFLNNPRNRSLIRGVIAAGNTNFGDSYCFAGDIISRKCQVPYLYRFELMGTTEDVERVREGVSQFWNRIGEDAIPLQEEAKCHQQSAECHQPSPMQHQPSPMQHQRGA